ncbi:MAG: hypothetical protein U0M12_04325 [Acutalibacteraceae bacterium]|nr:hypothetical protein [Acutalibacteraceae bacterium]
MSNGFKNTEDKRTKPVRLAVCVCFIIEIILLASPYIAMIGEDGTYYSKTMLQLILGMNTADIRFIKLGFIAILFAVVPIVGFLFASFDKNSCVKSVVGCLCSVAGIFGLTFIVPQFSSVLAFGAMMSILVYLLIFALCISLTLKTIGVRALKRQEEELAKEHNEA